MPAMTVNEIAREIVARKFSPVYLLMGPESFYIDYLCDLIAKYSMDEEDKELNMTTFYGKDVCADDIIQQALRYPIMAERQVVFVKEMQSMEDNPEKLVRYMQKPQPATVLVLCYKNGSIDKRKKIVSEINRIGIVFESAKIKDNMLPQFITAYCKGNGYAIDPNAAGLMAEYIGSDLNRIANELKKLFLTAKDKKITSDDVNKHIGVTREYSTYEFRDAISSKNIIKANTILNYMEEHTKTYPIQMILPNLFAFFSNLMLAYYSPSKDEKGIAQFLGLKNEWQAKEYIKAMSLYKGRKVMEIIEEIKNTDAKSKGFGSGGNTTHLLKELVYFILH